MDGFVKPATAVGEDRASSSYFAQAHGFTVHHVGPSYHQSTGRPGLETLLANSAPSAEFNSKVRSYDTPKCDEDTRVGLIDEILAWSIREDPITSNMLCMTGSAGSGKSALAQTVAESCARKGTLAASFFFNSGDPERNRTDRFIASLAYQVARSFGASRPLIVYAVETDPSIFTKALDWQAEVLLFAPVQEALRDSPSPSNLIIVDGLDECKGEDDQEQAQQEQILRFLHRCAEELPFRIFLTSRPEPTIRAALAPDGFLDADVYQILLNNHDATKDIQLYLERKLRAILRSNVPEGWTFQGIIKLLVERASGLFVHASTVVKFVGERQRSPLRRLKIILEGRPQQGAHPLAKLDALYSSILFAAQAAYDEIFEADAYGSEPSSFVHRLWTLCIMTKTSWYPSSFVEEFLHWDAGDIERVVEDLRSVVKSVLKDGRTFRLEFYHKSFQDYLEDPERCAEFGVARLPACHTLLSMALDYVSSATAEECSESLVASDPSPLEASVKLLPELLSMSSAPPITDAHMPSFDQVNEALRRFSACHGWDTLLKAFTYKFREQGRRLDLRLIEIEKSHCRGVGSRGSEHSKFGGRHSSNRPGGFKGSSYHLEFAALHSDLVNWIDLQDKILAMVAWEDRTNVMHLISAFSNLAAQAKPRIKESGYKRRPLLRLL